MFVPDPDYVSYPVCRNAKWFRFYPGSQKIVVALRSGAFLSYPSLTENVRKLRYMRVREKGGE